MTQAKHTPTPWMYDAEHAEILYDDKDVRPRIAIIGDNTSPEQQKADGEIIVRAVNCHAELVAALDAAKRMFEYSGDGRKKLSDPTEAPLTYKQICAALEKAKAPGVVPMTPVPRRAVPFAPHTERAARLFYWFILWPLELVALALFIVAVATWVGIFTGIM